MLIVLENKLEISLRVLFEAALPLFHSISNDRIFIEFIKLVHIIIYLEKWHIMELIVLSIDVIVC